MRPLSDGRGFNLYYRLAPGAWGHGYATEVAHHAVQRISSFGPTRIVALVRPENEPSISVARRVGLVQVGWVRETAGVQLRFELATEHAVDDRPAWDARWASSEQ